MRTSRNNTRSIVLAGIAAGIASTCVEIVLWLLFTDAFPAVLFRDARLAAAIVTGRSVLQPAEAFDGSVLLTATVVHFALSIVFAAALAVLVGRSSMPRALAAGVTFGVALYALNLYVMTSIFPWFAVSRGPITLAAHIAFGASAAAAYRSARRALDKG